MKQIFLSVAFALLVFASCAHVREIPLAKAAETRAPGTLRRVERTGSYNRLTLRALLHFAKLPERVKVEHGVTVYRLEYWTTRYDGAPTLASGVVALPNNVKPDGVVSYQHGTSTSRANVPSKPGLGEGVFGAALFAGGGYIFVGTDYIGLGVSHEVHPYLQCEGTVNAVVDLLKAANTFTGTLGVQWPTSLYVTGLSQGGHATAAVQRSLETMNDPRFHIVASGLMSGPYNLAELSFPAALNGNAKTLSLYLAYMMRAYCEIYGHPLNSILLEPYATKVPELFDGKHDGNQIEAAVPEKPRDMFQPAFLDDFDHGRPTWLLDALAKNEAFKWTPKAPIRAYYGSADKDVTPKETQQAVAEWQRRGANVQIICVGEYGHEQSIIHAIPMVRKWFDEVRAQTSKKQAKNAIGLPIGQRIVGSASNY